MSRPHRRISKLEGLLVNTIPRASRFSAARPRRRGLTLIEVLIVIAILLAIGGLVVVNLIPRKEQADIDLQKVQFQNIDGALKQFKLDMKRYPSDEEGLAALWDKSLLVSEDEATNWRGKYLESPITKDTWGSELVYHCPGEVNTEGYDLVSFGPDKQEGTEDDITNASSQGTSGSNADSGDGFAPPPDSGSGASGSGGG
jgi:general secretion pathway protein G